MSDTDTDEVVDIWMRGHEIGFCVLGDDGKCLLCPMTRRNRRKARARSEIRKQGKI